jgi:hypothetical protein
MVEEDLVRVWVWEEVDDTELVRVCEGIRGTDDTELIEAFRRWRD